MNLPQNFQPVSSYPGYSNPQTPTTIDPSVMSAIGGAFSALGSGVHNLLGSSNYSYNFNKPQNQIVNSPAPVTNGIAPSVPPITNNVTPDQSNFQFQMGQHSYPQVRQQLQNFLGNSPMAQYIDNFIQAGEKYGVDPRILPVIANNESSLGRNYPTQTNNPFGYTVGGVGTQALANAGFTSIPMAIDRLTYRFARPDTPSGYAQFRQNPTIQNLQAAYNANPAEQATYIKNAQAALSYFK